jgi:hypothetical protein
MEVDQSPTGDIAPKVKKKIIDELLFDYLCVYFWRHAVA